jgi:hypothetical protein
VALFDCVGRPSDVAQTSLRLSSLLFAVCCLSEGASNLNKSIYRFEVERRIFCMKSLLSY